jgi:hypothetical protein
MPSCQPRISSDYLLFCLLFLLFFPFFEFSLSFVCLGLCSTLYVCTNVGV